MKNNKIKNMHNTMVIKNFNSNSKQNITNKVSKIKIYKNRIKPNFEMHTIYINNTLVKMR